MQLHASALVMLLLLLGQSILCMQKSLLKSSLIPLNEHS